ncbi:hypothetical protein [Halopiger aswanensis]|uniref:Uncharacterized protein n=1 Tax=Halopiger aswanensis TaxID=148449 RepID=A0A419VVM3_9EURY|nr:hypothetical protein [Halopiger aswanensis]RKD86220.1 hypothetical protein ATJ93_4637 [Halopiger aswanensis]
MSADRYASEQEQNPIGTDFESDLKRTVNVVRAGFGNLVDEDGDQSEVFERVNEHVSEINDFLDDEDVPAEEQIAAAWFFLLQFASE